MRGNLDINKSERSDSSNSAEATILLVEDDPLIRSLGCRLLETFHYKVYVAASVAEAQENWDKHQSAINLVIADVMLPDGTAPEMIRRFRTDKPDMKVIYTSGYSDDIIGSDEESHDDTAFVQKPFQPQDLLQHIQAALGKK